MRNHLLSLCAAACVLVTGLSQTQQAEAAEGALSHYLPGAVGDVALAFPPEPGWQAANVAYYQSGHVGRAVLQGRVDTSLHVDLALDILTGLYTFEEPILGAAATTGFALPIGYAKLKGSVTGPNGIRRERSKDDFDVSDLALTPLALSWNSGNFSFKIAQGIVAPTGGYKKSKVVNLGRNYWSFDTIGAITWLNSKTGTEVSVLPGIMFNTKNKATNYRTGNEFHVDAVANQFLSKTFALGLRGYYYKQISGDSGSGAKLGDFKSESLGLGGGIVWTPAATGGKLVVAGRFMTDVHAKNRFKSDYSQLTLAWKF